MIIIEIELIFNFIKISFVENPLTFFSECDIISPQVNLIDLRSYAKRT